MSSKIIVYYRLSDRGFCKVKPDYICNKNCFNNFLKNFKYDKLYVVADNVTDETYDILKTRYTDKITEIFRTSVANRKSFIFAYDHAVKNNNPEDVIYFVENDYVHCSGSAQILMEGIGIADYVTLYDHPDKYMKEYRDLWPTKCYATDNSHWVFVPSTPMTFAAKVKTLIDDADMFDAIIRNNNDTHTNSKAYFTVVLKRGKTLVSPIPSLATHGETEWLAPFIDWAKVIVLFFTLTFVGSRITSYLLHRTVQPQFYRLQIVQSQGHDTNEYAPLYCTQKIS